jgi:signal transduction histidine kinase/DNA-binding response OmpR family regulator/ligand-binding sensor domain-containing protein
MSRDNLQKLHAKRRHECCSVVSGSAAEYWAMRATVTDRRYSKTFVKILFADYLGRLALIFLLAAWPCLAHAADTAAPVHNVDGSFVREWLVLGPFPSRDMETDFLAGVGGEANVRPKEGDAVTTKDGKQLVWTRFHSSHDVVDLEPVLGSLEWSVVYAYCEVQADEPAETDVRMASWQASGLLFNGKVARQLPIRNRFDLPPVLPIQLKAGLNRCLLKLRFESQPPYAFVFQPLPPQRATLEFHVTSPEGRAVPDAVIQFYDRGEPVARLATDGSGNGEACLYPLAESYDLQITSGEMGTWLHGVSLRPSERRKFEVALRRAISVSGKVLAMDGSSQAAIIVQALPVSDDAFSNRADRPALPHYSGFASEPRINPAGEGNAVKSEAGISSARRAQSLLPTPPFSKSVLTDTNGNFQFVNLRPGPYRLRAHGAHGLVNWQGEKGPEQITVEPGRENEEVKFVFPQAKRATWRSYPMRKELIEVSPSILHQTSDGMLWIGSFQNTLHSFDGVEFKESSSPGIVLGAVRALAQDASGTLWIGAEKGISRIVGGRMETVPFSDTLPGKDVATIQADPDGSVWFSTTMGLVQSDGQQFHRWTIKEGAPSNDLGGLLRARDRGLWMSTSRSLARFDGRAFTEPVLLSGLRQPVRERLYQARDGAIWFCSALNESAVYRYDGTTLSRLGEEEGLPASPVWDIGQTSDGILWFATDRGLLRFDGTTILAYTVADGLSWGGLLDIFVDADDVIWCATYTDISRFDAKTFSGLTKRDGLMRGGKDALANVRNEATSVYAIEPDANEGYLVGTEWGGVFRLSGKGGDQLTRTDFLTNNYVTHIQRSDDGTLWFGTADGIYKQAEGRTQRVLDRNWIIALNRDDQGQFWFGQAWIGGGVSRYNPKTGAVDVFTKQDGLPDDSVWAVTPAPDGGVWIGTSNGLAEFRDGKIQNVGERLGIRTGSVTSLGREADGTMWIGCDTGVHRLIGTNLVSVSVTNAAPIRSSVRTADGILWIGTAKKGLLGFDGQVMTGLDKRDGLLGNSVSCLRPDTDGSLLVGLRGDGITRYRRTKTAPSVRFVEAKLDDRAFSDFRNLPSTEIGKLVSVQYQEIDLKTHPDKRQFKYRVEGPSGQTLEAGITQSRRFEWKPKKGGTYTFEVQAIDRDLNYSKPARLTIRATVPWYANAWITVPGGGLFGGLAIWTFIARALYVRQRRESERLREQMLLQERQSRAALEESNRSLAEAKHAAEAANRAKSTFLANMSHEIRTPLNAVLGYAQILQQDRSLGTDQRQSAATIERSGSHLLSLINEVLDLSKIEAGKMELSEKDFDLRELIRSLSEMFELRCRQKGLEWRVEWELTTEHTAWRNPSQKQLEESANNTGQEIDSKEETHQGREDRKEIQEFSNLRVLGDLLFKPEAKKSSLTDSTDEGSAGTASDPSPSVTSVVSSSESSLCLNPIPVRGDEVKLRQVLINLLGNAVKFTEHGEVVLRIEFSDQLPVISGQQPTRAPEAPRITDHCSLITFSVIDTGPGIPTDLRDKIFEPFTQGEEGRQHGGTGLGLAIARRQIELMGGELRLDSEPGRGSRFCFSLRFAPALAQEQESAAMLHKPPPRLRAGTHVRALVADDVAENRDILGRVLRAFGADVTDVRDGEQAFRELSSQPYDIAFLDIRMPGMTGYQVAQRISAEGGPNRAKLVAISASVLKHEQESYAEAGFDGFVPKPYRFEQIRECLEKHLGVTCEEAASEVGTSRYDVPARAAAGGTALGEHEPQAAPVAPLDAARTAQRAIPTGVADAGGELDPGLAARYPLRILLADDYLENRELGARILQGFGYSCERAGNGFEVIAALERQRFDLVFLDVHMPELDGLEAARRIRERWSDAERPWLVAMTASVERGDREICLEAGMDDYVPKPVEIAGIRRVLEEAGKRRASENRGPHLDEAPIAWARLELMLGKEDAVLREFLEKHCRRTAERIGAMRAALEAGNASELEILVHGCKGTNANFGLRALVRPAQELENAARSGDLSSGARLLEELQQAFAQVQNALQARFPRRG